jgi:hypothetical protein
MAGINDRHGTSVSRRRARTDPATARGEFNACLRRAIRRTDDRLVQAWLRRLLRDGEFVKGGLGESDG